MTSPARSWVNCGFVARAHGVRGELRIEGDGGAFPLDIPEVRLVPRNGQSVVLAVSRARAVHEAVLLTLDGIADRDAASALKGSAVEIDGTLLAPAEDGNFYFYELLGASVVDDTGRDLGALEHIYDNNGQALAGIRPAGEGAEERLLPLVDATVVAFERDKKVLRVRLPVGIWE